MIGPCRLVALAAAAVLVLGSGVVRGEIVAAEGRVESGLQNAAATSFYPSLNQLWVRLNFDRKTVRTREAMEIGETSKKVTVELLPKGGGQAVATGSFKLPEDLSKDLRIDTPKLSGEYEVVVTFFGEDGSGIRISQPLNREHFPWEGNQLGISDEVPKPFTPVTVKGNDAEVVLRTYTMNDFGLMDRIVADGAELLAAPMQISFTLADGTRGEWTAKSLEPGKQSATSAEFVSRLTSAQVEIETKTTIEYDGVAKVEMTLKPGAKPAAISALWMDIPLKSAEVPLYHTYVDRNRVNPSTFLPKGEGVVWTGTDAPRAGEWQNSFTPYIWMGAEGPGLAWFGENDRGYFTETGGSKKPIQEMIREGDRVTLRVYFINREVTLEAPSTLVFGLQATPTKPMPENWRTVIAPGMSGPVVPWGGLFCACKTPYLDDWTIVDKIVEGRKTGKADIEWFAEWQKKNNPPLVHGKNDWLGYQRQFAEKAAGADGKPLIVYFEEMRASRLLPEWGTFAAEWSADAYPDREVASMDVMRRGFDTQPNAAITFPDSYINYGLFNANEWMKRGVGLYWDNTYPMRSTDTRMTAAYETPDGKIQPATVLWQQREYMQRMYNLLTYWQENQDQPLQWSNHITNTLLAPLQTYGTTVLDLEWGRDEPFPPEFLRTETIGRQVGVIPNSLYAIRGTVNLLLADESEESKGRIEWGMRAVHEIRTGEGLKLPDGSHIRPAYGYGTERVKVHNYWEREPVLSVSSPDVFWIAFTRPDDKSAVVILQSYNAKDVQTTIQPNKELTASGGPVRNAETGEVLAEKPGDVVAINLPGPYGTAVISIGDWTPIENPEPPSGFVKWPEITKSGSQPKP